MPLTRLLHPTNKALRDLALRGYLIHDGQVWWIADDDIDKGLEEVLIGPASGSAEDTFWDLEAAGWPRDSHISCPKCHDVEVVLGEFCRTCLAEFNRETAGEAQFEARREGI
jgi:hypothetical protein